MVPVSFPWGTIKGGAHTASERGLPSLLMSPSLHYCSDGTAGGGADREMDTASERGVLLGGERSGIEWM